MKSLLIVFCCLLWLNCSTGKYTSTVTPGYTPPAGEEIALTYIFHADEEISNKATEVLTNQLLRCKIGRFMRAADTEKRLNENNLAIPRRITASYLASLGDLLPAKYLLTGSVDGWKQGELNYSTANNATEVSFSLTLYEIATGAVVWTATGQGEGASGVFAPEPERQAAHVVVAMLQKWSGWCEASY